MCRRLLRLPSTWWKALPCCWGLLRNVAESSQYLGAALNPPVLGGKHFGSPLG